MAEQYLPPPGPIPRQPHRNTMPFESYIHYVPPTTDTVEDAELGLDVAYQALWADQIFLWLSAGKSLVSWCEQEGKPARSRVLQWLQDVDPQFDFIRERFEKGMLNRAAALIDESSDVADEPLVVNSKGFFDPISMTDKKQRFDAKLRMAALLDPVKFSPTSKVAQSIALTQINVTTKNVVSLTDEQLNQVVAEAERRKLRDSTAEKETRP